MNHVVSVGYLLLLFAMLSLALPALHVATSIPPLNRRNESHRPMYVKKLDRLQFLHVPKCGTSFILIMREYLDACAIKNVTCNGVMGQFVRRKELRSYLVRCADRSVVTQVVDCGRLIRLMAGLSPTSPKSSAIRHNSVTAC